MQLTSWLFRSALIFATASGLGVVAGTHVLAQSTETVEQMTLEDVEAAYRAGDFETARAGLLPFAEAGDVTAQYRLGFMMVNGSGGPLDLAEAKPWLEKAVAQGNVPGLLLLARTYLSDSPEVPDFERAAELLGQAVEHGSAEAGFYLGQLKRRGTGVEVDKEGAFALMNAAARGGVVDAQVALAQMYARGEGVEADEAQASRWLLEAAEAGNGVAQMSLYTNYDQGLGFPKDPVKARKWLEIAAEGGVAMAQRILGTELLTAEGDAADPVRGIALLLAAAEAGEAGAQSNLGFAYATGAGVEADDSKAAKYYQMAAEQGLVRAALVLGDFYVQGRGVERDIEKATRYYGIAVSGRSQVAAQRLGSLIAAGEVSVETVGEENALYWVADAALVGDEIARARLTEISEGGEVYADLRLGDLYRDGAVVEADPQLAAQYYLKAANAGYGEAQYQLAELFAAGSGVDQNYIEAHKWANVAAANGWEPAAERRDLYAQLMTPDQIAEAQARARVYMKK